jgi:hypothetical protein
MLFIFFLEMVGSAKVLEAGLGGKVEDDATT